MESGEPVLEFKIRIDTYDRKKALDYAKDVWVLSKQVCHDDKTVKIARDYC